MSEYDSEDEEAMVMPRDYDGDEQHSISCDSSDYSYDDAEAMADDYAATKAYFTGFRAIHNELGYQPKGSLIADSYS